jgi:hypothetical protein
MYGLSSYLQSKALNAKEQLPETGTSLHYTIPKNCADQRSPVPQASTISFLLKACFDLNMAYNLKRQALVAARKAVHSRGFIFYS